MSTNKVLSDFASALLSGSIKVVDLTAPLGPETPVIYLPQQIGKNTPAVKVHEISRYDQNGPFWSWNWLELGEHTIGDVNEHGARVFPIGLRPGVPLHPDRAAIVFASELDHDAAGAHAFAN